MTERTTVPGVLSPRRSRTSLAPLAGVLLLIVAVLGGLYAVAGPRLALTNQLAGPVRLTVEGEVVRTLAPGRSARLSVPLGRGLAVEWELVPPLSADGRPMGERVRELLVVPARWGTTRRNATARADGSDYFAPLITNASDDLLRITVNAGLQGAMDCGCAVRPGARRTFIGYYRLYRNSTVQAAAGPRQAVFRDLGSEVASAGGVIGLRFESRDLRSR